ncbi:MAG TPA: SusC/RagA family TonB-linked outer membrane protein [Chryseolinea sp.]|nr:SusC/RagA family TonB-linked outer membrane protein [Chryseolinea sp.]
MKKCLPKLIVLLLLCSASAMAQTITGRVTSGDDGSPLPGVSVIVKSSTIGTTTDANGRYSITVTDGSSVLVASFIGFATQEVAVGTQTTIDFALREDATQLSEVVVTALGVPRETKTLVYATQSVKASELSELRDPNNVLNSLQGKIANVQVNQGSGGPGSGARIVLRGNRSIQGSNNALIVVDGVPINNSTRSIPGSDFGGIQSSDGASNVNPDDVESITVLRGPSAAALYGSQAGNGVILITTKKGTKDNKVTVNLNSGITAEQAFQVPDVQNTYGQGIDGQLSTTVGDSWGARMDGQSYTNHLGETRSYSPQSDNIKDFFRTGVSLNNSIGLQGGGEKVQTYLGYTNNVIKGIVPQNEMVRHNVTLRMSSQITSKISTDAKVTYIHQEITGRPRTGEENSPAMDMYQTPRSIGIDDVKNFEATNDVGLPVPTPWPATLSSIYQNPYWMIYRTSLNENRDRLIGFLTATYQINDWLGVTGRANLDKTMDQTTNSNSVGTVLWASKAGGYFQKVTGDITQQWYDAAIHGDKKLGDDFRVNFRAGGIFQDTYLEQDDATADGLNVNNKFALNFATAPSVQTTISQVRTQSVFATASIGWRESIFLEGTFRNEWDSRLPPPYNIPYYSVGLSGIISDLVELPKAISFLKLNANYAQVGNGGQPQLRFQTFEYQQGAGNGFIRRSPTQAIPGLKPELVSSIELGLDARFFENRFGFTLTYYKSHSENQLLNISQPVATGFSNKYVNAGDIQNQGVELILNATPVTNGDFNWDLGFNLGLNRNKVLELLPNNPDQIFYLGGVNARSAVPIIRTGGSYGEMLAYKWQRDDNGSFVVNPTTGLPVATKDLESGSIGNFNPKALLGLTNTFTYKGVSLRLLVDGRIGGIIVDGTEMNLAYNGITKATATNREEGWNLGGVDEDGNPVNVNVTAQQFWSAGESSVSGKRYGVGEFFAYDATNFRIREISLGYKIPVPANFFIKSARFSLVARNLAWLYRGSSILNIPGLGTRKLQIDPDMSLGNGNYQGVQYGSLPSTRSIGCNLSLTF